MSSKVAYAGTIWVCSACGKRSHDVYGSNPVSRGWDESCAINAVLCREDSLVIIDGKVVKAIPAEPDEAS